MKKNLSTVSRLLIVLAVVLPLTSQAEVDWKRFDGESINAIFFTAAYIDAWFRPMAKRFKEETGVTIRWTKRSLQAFAECALDRMFFLLGKLDPFQEQRKSSCSYN